MVFRKAIVNPQAWHKVFCWNPVTETVINADGSATIITFWLTTIERRLICNNMTGIRRWDYRKSPDKDEGVNAV